MNNHISGDAIYDFPVIIENEVYDVPNHSQDYYKRLSFEKSQQKRTFFIKLFKNQKLIAVFLTILLFGVVIFLIIYFTGKIYLNFISKFYRLLLLNL
jgi:ABC-type multidrug transport system permease subunit